MASNLKTVNWRRPTKLAVLNEGSGGIGSAAFRRLAAELGSPVLPAITRGADWKGPGRIALLGFSAAHGLMSTLAADGRSLDLLSCYGAFDSWYGTLSSEGHLTAATRAAQGHMLAVFTASDSPDPRAGSCWKYVRPLVSRFGCKEIDPRILGLDGMRAQAWRSGGLYVAHGPDSTHREHATLWAPAVCNALVAPRLAGEQAASGERSSGLGLLALLYLAARAVGLR